MRDGRLLVRSLARLAVPVTAGFVPASAMGQTPDQAVARNRAGTTIVGMSSIRYVGVAGPT